MPRIATIAAVADLLVAERMGEGFLVESAAKENELVRAIFKSVRACEALRRRRSPRHSRGSSFEPACRSSESGSNGRHSPRRGPPVGRGFRRRKRGSLPFGTPPKCRTGL